MVETQQNALRIVACEAKAVRLGLTPGSTLADARARVPGLVAVEAQPQADQDLVERLAAFCDRFTPLVALDPPHGLVLDVTGCAHLFGGETGLLSVIARYLNRSALTHRAAMAGTPEAARALARYGPGCIVPPGQDERMVRPLPTAALDIGTDTVLALSRAGLKTVGDLADRPSLTLSARFGEGLVVRLHRALGREDVRITPLRQPPACMVESHFSEPLMDLVGLEDVVRRLIADAAQLLEQRGEGGRIFEVSLFRTDGAVRRLAVETSRPLRDVRAILRLYRERIETLSDPLEPGLGFDAVRFAVCVCQPLQTRQTSLDSHAVEDDAIADLVDRLITRFGRDRVLRFVALDSHDPRHEAKTVSAAASHSADIAWQAVEPNGPPLRPLQLFEPPQPIETLAEVPDGPPLRFRWRRVLHEIARAEGPERIAPEWWHKDLSELTRDYYRVEDALGRRFWLFRAGLYETAQSQPRWFLHGVFA